MGERYLTTESAWRKWTTSKWIALAVVFAALNVVFDSIVSLPEFPSGVWYSWNFMIEALTGIVLGPVLGFAATALGVMIGHFIYFIDAYEFLFTVGAPIGAAISALLYRKNWKAVLIYFVSMFSVYFASPVAWQLPFWGMWDTYLALIFLLAAVLLIGRGLWSNEAKRLPVILAISAFVGLEADVLFRIVLLVPGQTYSLFYGWDVQALQAIWTAGAIGTPLKALLATLGTVIIGHPLISLLRRTGLLADQ
jgi:predicted membrane protein